MDLVFKALADATRRRVLDLLHAKSGQTLSELCDGLAPGASGLRRSVAGRHRWRRGRERSAALAGRHVAYAVVRGGGGVARDRSRRAARGRGKADRHARRAGAGLGDGSRDSRRMAGRAVEPEDAARDGAGTALHDGAPDVLDALKRNAAVAAGAVTAAFQVPQQGRTGGPAAIMMQVTRRLPAWPGAPSRCRRSGRSGTAGIRARR